MEITEKTVQDLAHLARLEFNGEGLDKMITDLRQMLKFVDKLNELKTDGIEPLIYMNDEVNTYREDEAQISISQKDALKNAPKKDSDYFKAPKVIEK